MKQLSKKDRKPVKTVEAFASCACGCSSQCGSFGSPYAGESIYNSINNGLYLNNLR